MELIILNPHVDSLGAASLPLIFIFSSYITLLFYFAFTVFLLYFIILLYYHFTLLLLYFLLLFYFTIIIFYFIILLYYYHTLFYYFILLLSYFVLLFYFTVIIFYSIILFYDNFTLPLLYFIILFHCYFTSLFSSHSFVFCSSFTVTVFFPPPFSVPLSRSLSLLFFHIHVCSSKGLCLCPYIIGFLLVFVVGS